MKTYQTNNCQTLEDLNSSIQKNIKQQLVSADAIHLCYQTKISDADAGLVDYVAIVLQDQVIHFGSFNSEEGYIGGSVALQDLDTVTKYKVEFGHTVDFHTLQPDQEKYKVFSFTFTSQAAANTFEKKIDELISGLG